MTFHAKSDRGTIFQPQFVASLFDEMAATYGVVNVVSSFGFCVLWRKQCVRQITSWQNARAVADWMSGMGELWPDICRRCERDGDERHFARACEAEGLVTNYRSHFFGCASAVSGMKAR